MTFQDILCSVELQKRVINRHCKVAWHFGLVQFSIEFCGQDLIDLCVQHFDRACLRARKFFLQWDGIFEFPYFLQNPDNLRNSMWVMN